MRSVRHVLTLLCSCSPAFGQVPPLATPAGVESARAAEASKIAAAAAEGYLFTAGGRRATPLTLQTKPLLLWSNPVVGSIHGSVFVWTEGGKPEVVASIYKWYGPK